MTLVDIKDLRLKTGCSLRDAREAIKYAEEHEGCTPLGYLKAKTLAVRIESFEAKVKAFSAMERNKYD
jgi:translation elongation factor EF-Ts